MKFLKQSSIDTVIEEARIKDVVGDSENLVQKGAHWFCLSPFNNEKSPSLCVHVVKNFFYDNSAGFGGNAITFLMKRFGISFFEAVEKAAAICGINLEYEEQSEDLKRMVEEETAMKRVVAFAAEQYQKAYSKLAPDHWAKTIIEQRGYSEEIVQAFMIGFAPNERSYISTPAINNGNFEISVSLGLTTTKEGASYDFFRDRLQFPIFSANGTIIGFGGRRSNELDAEKFAKYINSKESKLYQKEKVLFGFFQAKKKISELRKAILVEGYTDVISLHQAGANNTVAPCGTSLTVPQVKLLARVAKTVVVFMDGDKAGLRAVYKDIDLLLNEDLTVQVVICPEGEDPDTLSRQCNINEFIDKNAKDAIVWKAEQLQASAFNPDLTDIAAALEEAYQSEAEKLQQEIAPKDAFKGLSAVDKKFLTKKNDDIFNQLRELERDMKNGLKDVPKYDPSLLAEAVQQMGNTLHKIRNSIKQKEYVKITARILEQRPATLTQIVEHNAEKEEKEKKAKSQEADKKESNLLRLPEGADKDQYLEDRFCVVGNQYWFHDNNGFFPGTNFRMQALFHVEGKQDNKRLCEVINSLGHKRLIDFESTELINFTKVQERLIMEGYFFFEPGVSTTHFKLMAKKLLKDFVTATEMKILGHQREGFFAYADGIYHNNTFFPVNKYGIVNIEGLVKEKSEYRSDISHYYSPSHSEIYKASREDDDPYENDRHFVYRRATPSLDAWMSQIVKVFGNKGKLGVAFVLAVNFRDLFLIHWKYFPILGGFGQRDSGKSAFGACLQSFFYNDLKALELNTSTLVGISRRLTRVKNAMVFFDEYRDDMDEEKKQQLKGTWNGIGREKGKGVDSTRTSTDKINSGLYYAGQYLPAGDDGALPSRTIVLNFEQKEYTAEEKEEYGRLVSWNNAGISSFITDVLQHRQFVEKELVKFYNEVSKELKGALKDVEYQNRIFDNYLVPLVIVKMLKERFNFPFTYEEYFQLTKDSIIDNSDMVSDADGLARFWRIVEYLANKEVKVLKENHDYQIEQDSSVKYMVKRGEQAEWKNKNHDKILYLSFSKVHQEYHKEASRRQGEDIISETVIRNYLKSKKYFIGLFAARRMGGTGTSGYAFNYSEMQRLGIVNLPSAKDDAIQTELEINPPRKHQIITNSHQRTANL